MRTFRALPRTLCVSTFQLTAAPELWDPECTVLIRTAVERFPDNTKISSNGWKLLEQLDSEPVSWFPSFIALAALRS